MGFLRNLLSGREIAKLEELLAQSPAPSLFLRLAQLYRENDNEEKAREVTARGARLFPESESLLQAQADGEKIKNDAEKRRLRAKIEQFPSPMLYTKLASLYIKERDFAEAEAVCNGGIRSFPDYGGLWTELGRTMAERGEFDQALECLEKAAAMDKYNYNAMMSLAETCLKAGRRDRAREAIEQILAFAPNDERATAFLTDFDLRAAKLEAEGRRVSRAAPKPAAPTPSTAPAAAPAAKSESGVGTTLHVEIKQIRRVDGVRGTILIDPAGLVIASDLPEGLDEELAAALISGICRTVKESAKALTLGEFEDGIVESGEGCIHLLTVDQMTMGVFATKETKAGLLQRAIHTFAERVIDMYN